MAAAAATAPEVGIPLGILIGVVTGAVAILLFRAGWQNSDIKGTFQVVGQLLAIPTFWFGGPWLTTSMLASVEPAEIRSSYFISLTAVFVPLASVPLVRLVREAARGPATQSIAHPGSGDA